MNSNKTETSTKKHPYLKFGQSDFICIHVFNKHQCWQWLLNENSNSVFSKETEKAKIILEKNRKSRIRKFNFRQNDPQPYSLHFLITKNGFRK